MRIVPTDDDSEREVMTSLPRSRPVRRSIKRAERTVSDAEDAPTAAAAAVAEAPAKAPAKRKGAAKAKSGASKRKSGAEAKLAAGGKSGKAKAAAKGKSKRAATAKDAATSKGGSSSAGLPPRTTPRPKPATAAAPRTTPRPRPATAAAPRTTPRPRPATAELRTVAAADAAPTGVPDAELTAAAEAAQETVGAAAHVRAAAAQDPSTAEPQPGAAPRRKVPAAGYATPSGRDGEDGSPVSDLVTTTVLAATELAQIGFDVGRAALRSMLERLPKP